MTGLWLKAQAWTLGVTLALLAVFVPLGGADLIPQIVAGAVGISLGATALCLLWRDR